MMERVIGLNIATELDCALRCRTCAIRCLCNRHSIFTKHLMCSTSKSHISSSPFLAFRYKIDPSSLNESFFLLLMPCIARAITSNRKPLVQPMKLVN